MINTLKIALAISVITINSYAASRCLHFKSALDEAKKSQRDIAVLFYGSNWNNFSVNYRKDIWNSTKLDKDTHNSIILVSINHPDNRSEKYEAYMKKYNSKAVCRLFNYPAIVVYDYKGRTIAKHEKLTELNDIPKLTEYLLEIRKRRIARDHYWKGVSKVSGIRQAELLGKGLVAIDQGLGYKGCYKYILEKMKKADPNDKSGYIARVSQSTWSVLSKVLDLCKEKKYEEAKTWLQQASTSTVLNMDQQQKLLAAKFALYRKWPNHQKEYIATLHAMIKLDPKHDMALGAAGWLKNLTGPPSMEYGWKPRHCKTTMQVWEFDCTKQIVESGLYDLSFSSVWGSKNNIVIQGIILQLNGETIRRSNKRIVLSRNKTEKLSLQIPAKPENGKFILKIRCACEKGTNCTGSISLISANTF